MNGTGSHESISLAIENSRGCADIDIRTIVNIAGQTPAYIYRRSVMQNKIQLAKTTLPDAVSLHYSVKANPLPQLVSYIAGFVDGMDVSSQSELLLAIATGLPASGISYSGPGKTDSELLAAIAAKVIVCIESLNELHRLLEVSEATGYKPNVAVRINPPFNIKRSGMVMGGGSQQFGIDLENIDSIFKCLKSNGLACAGLHCYPASQMLDEAIVTNVHAKTLDMLLALADTHELSGASLNIGGGLGIPYFKNEKELDIRYIGDALDKKLSSTGFEGKLIVELGRYLVADSGTYIAQVVDRKVSRGKTYLILDGGLNHHLAATGNLGQVIRKNFPISSSSTSENKEVVSIVGPLCTPLDILGEDVELPVTQVGELVAVHQSGAYGYSASPQKFLGHKQATEVFID